MILAFSILLVGAATSAFATEDPNPLAESLIEAVDAAPEAAIVPKEPARPVAENVKSRSEALKDLDDAAVNSYVDEFDVSETVARERLATQGMAPGVADILRARWGDAIADVWFDNDQDEWVVDATAAAGEKEVGSAFEKLGLGSYYRRVGTTYSQSDLERTALRLRAQLDDFVVSGLILIGRGFGKVTVTMSSELSGSDREAVQRAVSSEMERSGVPIDWKSRSGNLQPILQQVQPEPGLSCIFPYCNTLIGGDTYANADRNIPCSMSFPALLDGKQGMLTAGHCAIGTGNRPYAVAQSYLPSSPTPTTLGGVYLGEYNNRGGDWGMIILNAVPPLSSDWNPGLGRPYYGWHNWTHNSTFPLQYFYRDSIVPAGMNACKNGFASGIYGGTSYGFATRCGTTGQIMYNVVGPEVEIDNMSGCEGDSGSEVHVGNDTAIGIHQAANGSPCGAVSYMTPLSNVFSWAALNGHQLIIYAGP